MKKYILVVLTVIAFLILSGCTTQQQNSDQKNSGESNISGEWLKESGIIFSGTTSTSSIVLSNGTIRTYLMGDGIFYKESVDGKTFGDKVQTTITGMTFNPAIVYVEGKYILFYNVEPGTSPDPTVSADIQLWRAESTDGKTFTTPVKVSDMAEDPLAVIDVPDVIELPDGRLRIYATQLSGDGGINTAVSNDLGLTWTVDGTELIDPGACDPDVHIENGTKYVMYYTQTIAPEGMPKEEIKAQGLDSTCIMRATSTDGLKWELEKDEIISPLPEITKNGFVIDPDYVILANGTEVIYFGKTTGQDIDEGRSDVYRAVKTT
jgi:predicted GH43/DUF377 family glycosyl hydrolase